LSPGDVVGEGIPLQGKPIHFVSVHPMADSEAPVQEFEVVRRLGIGIYVVCYLVREVLFCPVPSTDGTISLEGMELDNKLINRQTIEYGHYFAIKCVSKEDLDKETLAAQKAQVQCNYCLIYQAVLT
jgi:hypothetical protein